jgi:hypothetical protein
MSKDSPSPRIFVTDKRRYAWVGAITVAAVTATAILAYCGWGETIEVGKPTCPVKVAQVIVLVAWTVVPPIWFWYEYWFIYLKGHRFEDRVPENFELFKYGQDVSAKIWLAIVSATFVIFFWKDIHLR